MMEDSSQLDDPLLGPNSNVAEMVSDVTKSEANRPVMQDSTDPDDSLSSANSGLVEVVSTGTESEAVRLLASRIPPELFDDILFFVNVDRVSQRHEDRRKYGRGLIRNRGKLSTDDILTTLKQCSLVCLFWANRCREHMFSDRTQSLWIQSYEDAEIFRRYIVEGCPRLTPVHQLIRRIDITQNYSRILAPQDSERQTSFLHLLYLPAIQDKLDRLSIYGPVPKGFNPAKLDTLHWGIPPCIVAPSSFLQNITWDGQTPTYSLPHASNTIARQRRPHSLSIRAMGVCTDSVHLALTALMLNPNCPLHRLSDEERVWMIKSMTLLWGDKKDPDVYIGEGFNVSEQATTMRMDPFHFVFEQSLAPTDRSASALSVVGMHAYINDWGSRKLPTNFDALVNHARTHPTIHALVLLFDSSDHLQESVKPFVEVLTLATETIELVLAYEEREERRAVAVDPVTLEHNGRIWTDLPVLTYDTCGDPEHHLKSLYILQRQLEKKPRGRLQ